MKKICERGLNWFQIYDSNGSVRLCSWTRDGYIGRLTDSTVKELYHNEHASRIRERLSSADYSMCKIDACPYLAMNEIEEHLIEYERVPEYPEEIYLGFEQICNYACTCCSVHKTMMENKGENLEKAYAVIEERIKDILPHVKKISANGCGELFISKHTLNILANWKPIADPKDIEVILETNGSLFDEEHWRIIENLGQYNLKVAVSVMSFDEPIYQYLSGTTLPISRIENNLRFIKSLREENIINYWEIATVVQEQNFRTIPEFARRSVEEFGADYVRIRPYEPWGAEKPDVAWFNDIRNPRHPYYKEYKKIMQHSIFQHPKVHDWSGGLDSEYNTYSPYEISEFKRKVVTDLCLNIQEIARRLLLDEKSHVVIYGIADVGKVLTKQLKVIGIKIDYIIDNYYNCDAWEDNSIFKLDQICDEQNDKIVIVTPLFNDKLIFKNLEERGFTHCISVKSIVYDIQLKKELDQLE